MSDKEEPQEGLCSPPECEPGKGGRDGVGCWVSGADSELAFPGGFGLSVLHDDTTQLLFTFTHGLSGKFRETRNLEKLHD